MLNIKKKDRNNNANIRKLDNSKIYSQRMKKKIINTKEKLIKSDNKNDSEEENSPTEYGINKITNNSKEISDESTNKILEFQKKSLIETKKNIEVAKTQASNKIKKKLYDRNIKQKSRDVKDVLDNIEDYNNIQNDLKSEFQNIKQIRKANQLKIKRTTNGLSKNKLAISQINYTKNNVLQKEAKKGFKKSFHITKVTAENIKKQSKRVIRTMILAIKAIIKSTKALLYAIMAFGSVSVFLIIIVCFIALICSSAMGIFFSNEMVGEGRTLNSVATEINTEFTQKIAEIQLNIPHDEFEIHSNRASWKDILTIYSVVATGGKDQSNVMIFDDKNIEILKRVFWEMNDINYSTQNVVREIQIINDDGSISIEKHIRKVLYIDITSKSVDQMIDVYNFNKNQRLQLAEIRKDKYNDVWTKVLCGISGGSSDIVQVALSQIGNSGGETFWRWYGFNARVEWCACFVSWCANECGYIDAGIIPKFAACHNEGIAWFQACGLWQERGYIPNSRRYNLF